MSGLEARWTTTLVALAIASVSALEVVDFALDDHEPRVVRERLEVPAPTRREVVVDGDALDVGTREQSADEVAADEAGAADDDDVPIGASLTALASVGGALPLRGRRWRSGCETSRCHTTAHRPSVWGVMRSAYSGGITTTASPTRGV